MRLTIIGGGAAGFFCAVNAARLNPKLQVCIVEKSAKVLAKVRISGGGRCNVTHSCFEIAEMIKKYPRGGNFLKKTFHQFFTTDTIKWFEERGVGLKTEADGRMFPLTDSSETIVSCLMRDVNRFGVELKLHRDVRKIENSNGKWKIQYSDFVEDTSDFLCIACGGFPKASMFDWLTATGHTIAAPVPSLFTFNMPNDPIKQLMGVAVSDAMVKLVGSKLSASGPLLITHWGLSGPAVLKLSAWGAREFHERNYELPIIVNWLPPYNENSLREEMKRVRFEMASNRVINRNQFKLPQRLWEFLVKKSGIDEAVRWADLSTEKQNKLIQALVNYETQVKGKTTYKDEFVTAGGINLSELNPATMESKLHENLFFAGEIIDVDGITGGFNFQHAWTSGYIAAKAIAERSAQSSHSQERL